MESNTAFLRRVHGVVSPHPCDAFIERRNHQCCGWCFFPLHMHEWIDRSTWSPAGPYVATYTLTPNPQYQPLRESA